MPIDLPAAVSFMAGHARTLDRRRLEFLLGGDDPGGVLAALDGYRNPDGGYGWGLEPDLRAAESQPGGALHALEALGDIAPATSPRAVELCDWLASVALPDGGLAFALPVADAAATAPFWANADPAASSLQITSYVAGAAQRVAEFDPAVAGHEWPARATRYCLDAIAALGAAPHAIALNAALGLLDAVFDTHPEAPALLRRLGEFIPADGRLPVAGGAEGESLGALDLAPFPDRPVRALFAADVVERELEQLVAEQQDDGGWRVDFASYSPAAALEWRGYATVHAVHVLRRNGLA
ncbi:MAG: hypothetical protein Q8K79_04970 [Solirubrobacteraceae bacterium]|nr:hypothetical protein [Solirubrobacteraceae bacterium]